MRSVCILTFIWSLAEAARPMRSSMAMEGDAARVAQQALSGDPCNERKATTSGENKCQCGWWFIANQHCAEGDRGTRSFSLSKETSPECKCIYNDCMVDYQAGKQFWQKGQWMCKCTKTTRFTHGLCGVPWGSMAAFPLEPAKKGCKCLQYLDLIKLRPTPPVRVAAINLCTDFIGNYYGEDHRWQRPPLSPRMCHQVVAEGLAFGRLDPLVPGTAIHHSLGRVCTEECESLVVKITSNLFFQEFKDDINFKGKSPTETCADRVVRQVEANVLGCCAESCGYNGKSCMTWPFFTKSEKVTWLEECCTEFNVLSGSPREAMCNSVLTAEQAKKVSATDIKPKRGVDVGEPYVGQGRLLLWTRKGVESELGRKYSQSQEPPKPNDPVASQVMEENPQIRAKALEKKWFTEKPIIASDAEKRGTSRQNASAFMEASGDLGNGCDLKKIDHCTSTFQEMKLHSCVRQGKWKISAYVQAKNEAEYEEGCPKGNVQHVATPEDCLAAFPNEATVKSYFFEFAKQDENPLDENSPAAPIKCFVETEESPCDAGHPSQKTPIEETNKEDLSLEYVTFWLDAKDFPDASATRQ